ncbi:centromere-associated protein E [Aplochiton taeniatus]
MAEESAVKVCVRVRPLIERERASAVKDEPVQLYWRAEKQSIHQIEDGNSGKSFCFDRVFNSEETTDQLYQDFAKPLVVSTVEGYNGTIFAYGQTASGKTFTMMGNDLIPGVIPLAMKDVFQAIKNLPKKEFLLRVSYMEIYNETVTDLLGDSTKRRPLEIREGSNKNVYVGDLTEEVVTSPEQALGWIRKGEKNRHYGETKMNQRSSRSHTIFRMILESRNRSDTESGESSDGAIIVSHLNLVDLAGAERASQTGAEGARFKEGCNINRSLFALCQVIKKLSDESQKGFISYRDSKLTRILQNSLGGNAKTVIICTVTAVVIEETISTLQFASAAQKMKNDPHVTEVSDDGALLKRYRNEIEDLKRRLQEVSLVTQANANEKETLSQLLQERDQLQLDQEDRIKNLTNLLVTSSTFVKRMPKRRVTWGGKLVNAAQAEFHNVESDFSFVEPFSKRNKIDLTVLQEEGEFDSRLENPEEPNFDRTEQNNVTMGSFSDSESPCWMNPAKLSCLERELESESRLKREAEEKVEALERQLEEKTPQPSEEQEQIKKQFEETIQLCENLVSEKDMVAVERDYLKQELSIFMEQIENLEKEKTTLEKERTVVETSELACKELEANLQSMSEELKQKVDLAEELQNLNGRDLVQQVSQLRRSLDDAEGLSRDTKKEWAFLRSENISLKEKDLVLTANHEKMESEVNGLRYQLEAAKSRFNQMQLDLQRELQGAFEENTKLTALLDGKVPKNLMDSLELERTLATLKKTVAASHGEGEVLRAQLQELSSLKCLPEQVDLLKNQVQYLTEELCEVRAERDGLLSASSLHAQTSEARLLEQQREAEQRETQLTQQCAGITEQLEALRADLEHAAAENVRLLATAEDYNLRESEHAQAAGGEKWNEVQQQVNDLEEKLADSELARSTEEEIGKELQEQINQLTEELESVRVERDSRLSEKTAGPHNSTEELEQLVSTVTALTEERDQLKEILERLREERKTDVEEKMETVVQIQVELQQQQQLNSEQQEILEGLREERTQLKTDVEEKMETINQLTEELESVRVERDSLLSEKTAGPHNSTEELEQLVSTVTALTEERDQLKEILEGLREERKTDQEILEGLREERTQLKTDVEEKMETINQLTEELESVRVERDSRLSEKTAGPHNSTEELEQLLSTVTALTEERDQLKEILEGLREERNSLQTGVEEKMETINQLTEELESVRAERDSLLSEKTAGPHNSTKELEQLLSTVTALTEERDQLKEILEGLREERNQLKTDVEEKMETVVQIQVELQQQQQLNSEQQEILEGLREERTQLKTDVEEKMETINQLTEELESVRVERDSRLSEKTAGPHNSTEKLEQLLSTVTALTEERDQLKAILEGLREERNSLQNAVEEKMETVVQIQVELQQQQQLNSEQQEILEGLREERTQLKTDLAENVEMMIENQQELRDALEKNSKQKERIGLLESAQTSGQHNLTSGGNGPALMELQSQVSQLTEELESVRVERDSLLSEKTAGPHNSTEELEQLLSTVTALTEERDQLKEILEGLREERVELQHQQQLNSEQQEILEGLREERTQLKTDVEEKMETVELQQQQTLNSEQQEILEGLREERNQLNADLEESTKSMQHMRDQVESLKVEANQFKDNHQKQVEMAAETQGLLHAIQEELQQQVQLNSNLESRHLDMEECLKQQINQLTEELESVRVERDGLLSEKTAGPHNSTEELEQLLSTVTALTEERDQLKEILEGLREERNSLQTGVEEKMETVVQIQVELQHQQQLNSEQQEILEGLREERTQLKMDIEQKMETVVQIQGELQHQQQLNSEQQEILEGLSEERDQLNADQEEYVEEVKQLKQKQTDLREERGQLQKDLADNLEMMKQLEGEFDVVKQSQLCAKTEVEALQQLLSDANVSISELKQTAGDGLALRLQDSALQVQLTTDDSSCQCKLIFQETVRFDLAAFEERRLQDVLLCQVQAPSYSVAEDNLKELWDQRLSHLLDKRQHYLQRTANVLSQMEATMASQSAGVSSEVEEMVRFNEELRSLCGSQPLDLAALDDLHRRELARRSAVASRHKVALEALVQENKNQVNRLVELQTQAHAQMKEERSKTATLLQALQSAPVKTEAQLLENNQQLLLQLENCQRDLERRPQDAAPSAVELDKLRAKLVKMEVELMAASSQHQEEIDRMSVLLNHKENALRKLKETLRRAQQEDDDTVRQGVDLHARLTATRGHTLQSSVVLEKNKLEEEVKKLKMNIAELESLVSSQQTEIAKWKSRAVKAKGKCVAVGEKPRSPCTPTKRRPPTEKSEFLTPTKKFLDSPKKPWEFPSASLLHSPKTKFFDIRPGSESMSINCPKQFFDNSHLGTIPDANAVPDTNKDLWPLSPKHEDICKQQ